MSCEFNPGTYSINIGKSLFDKSDNASSFYTLRFHSKLDPTLPSRKASLRQDDDNYIAEWALGDGVASYEGTPGNLQEMECLLVFDEETQTFTLERPSLKMTMKKVRRKKGTPSNTPSSSSSTSKINTEINQESSTSIPTEKIKKASTTNVNSNNNNNSKATTDSSSKSKVDSPMSLALPPPKKPQDTQKEEVVDSFDDILRDMDDILNSNDDDDDDDDDDNEIENKHIDNNNNNNNNNNDDDDDDDDVEFETITTPYIPTNNLDTNTPTMTSKSPQSMESIPNQQQQSAGKRRRPPVKMASAPIRRLDDASPSIAPVSSSPSGNVATVNTPALPQQQGNKRPRTGGKTTPAAILEARRRAVAASDSDSSSGSSSSGSSDESGSSSEDDDSGSSGSGSSSDSDDDDVMDLLAENITRGLSEDRSIQPSSQNETSAPNHYRQSPHQQGTSSTPNINRPAAGPTSLRDLLDGGRGQEDEVSSSGSSSEEEF